MAATSGQRRPRGRASRVRIIGGDWRGRRLAVPAGDGLRPTPDRVRETLFNWLAADLRGARVLDAFAGAGALGFEAASRGAGQVMLVEQNRRAVSLLERQNRELGAEDRVTVLAGDVRDRLRQHPPLALDLVFIDPPYERPELREQLLQALSAGAHLNPGALLFVEWPRRAARPLQAWDETGNLTWIKQKQAGEVAFALARWDASG